MDSVEWCGTTGGAWSTVVTRLIEAGVVQLLKTFEQIFTFRRKPVSQVR